MPVAGRHADQRADRDPGLLPAIAQLALPIVVGCVLIVLDDNEFDGVGSWLWFSIKLLSPLALAIAYATLRAGLDRSGMAFSTRLIRATPLWLALFALLTGPLSLFVGGGHLVNLYNERSGRASESVAVIESYRAVRGMKNTCAERFAFRVRGAGADDAIVRTERPVSCPVYPVARHLDGYSGRSAVLQLRRSWIGVSIQSMTLRPAQTPAATTRPSAVDPMPRDRRNAAHAAATDPAA